MFSFVAGRVARYSLVTVLQFAEQAPRVLQRIAFMNVSTCPAALVPRSNRALASRNPTCANVMTESVAAPVIRL